MIRRRTKHLLLTLSVLMAWAAAAHAGDFTIHAGGLIPGKLNLNNIPTALEGSPVIGVRFANNFARVIGLEHTLSYSPDFLKPETFPPDRDVKGIIYNTNLMLNVPVDHAIPYVTFGIGAIIPFGSDARLLFGTKFAVNYGGGLKFPNLAGPLGLRFDARGYTATNVLSDNLHIFEFTGGLFFTFGR